MGMAMGWGALENSGFPYNILLKLVISNLARIWGLPWTIIKSHPEEKVGVALG